MSIKTHAALFATMTLAFSAPAFAQDALAADGVIQTGTAVETAAAIEIEPVIELGTASDYDPTPFYQATPVQIERRVAGTVVINDIQINEAYAPPEYVYAPTLEFEEVIPEPESNLDGFNEDNSQFHVDDAKTVITFGADRSR